jgi:hypothetical protein
MSICPVSFIRSKVQYLYLKLIFSNNAYWLRLQFCPYLNQYIIDNFVISGTSLLLVGMLGMVIIFIYALVSFAVLRERFLLSSLGRHCTTVYECFITVLHHGFVDSLYTVSVTKYRYKSNLYIKTTQANLKMWPLWAFVLYVQVKITVESRYVKLG